MERSMILSLCLLTACIFIQVEGGKRKPLGHPTKPPKLGWRLGNGPCVCTAKGTSSTPRSPTRLSGNHHPTAGHHPSGPHGHPRHPPTGHHGHQGRHGPKGHRHNGPPHHPPSRRPGNNHGHRGPRKHQRGRSHGRYPTRKDTKKRRCVCRKPAGVGFKIKFRMMKNWRPELAIRISRAYKQMTNMIKPKLAKVLKMNLKGIHGMRLTKGSIVVQFEVKKSEITKDPKRALRNAIDKGQLSDLKIQPESLTVSESYSGVNLTEWKTEESDCFRCGSVTQTRKCIEITASCDGIPLIRNASCYEACPRKYSVSCGRGGVFRMAKVMLIASFIIVGMIVVVAFLIIRKVKSDRRKNLSTSPSTSSLKQLKDDDKLQSKC